MTGPGFASGDLPIRHGQILATEPGRGPRTWDRVSGMLLGLAVGDALGNTSEGRLRCNASERLVDDRLVPRGRLLLLSGTPHQGHRDRLKNLLRLLSASGREQEARGRVIYRITDDLGGRAPIPEAKGKSSPSY